MEYLPVLNRAPKPFKRVPETLKSIIQGLGINDQTLRIRSEGVPDVRTWKEARKVVPVRARLIAADLFV